MANRMGTRWRGKIPIPPHAHPLIRQLVRRANQEMTTLSEIADRAGMPRATISDWRYSRMPRLDNFEAALNAMGLKLAIVVARD